MRFKKVIVIVKLPLVERLEPTPTRHRDADGFLLMKRETIYILKVDGIPDIKTMINNFNNDG